MEDEEKRKPKKSRNPTDAEDQTRKKNLFEKIPSTMTMNQTQAQEQEERRKLILFI